MPAHPGGAARADAGRAHAVPLQHRGGGRPRQDHHHEPRGQPARRRRTRSHVRHRGAPARGRHEREAGRGRVPRGGGRRERRLVPAASPHHRGGHQHRRRPHVDLRRGLRAAARRVSRVSPPAALLRARGSLHRRSACSRVAVIGGQVDRDLRHRHRGGPRGYRDRRRGSPHPVHGSPGRASPLRWS